MVETIALIVAGGRGSRFGGTAPKQYQGLAGVPLIRHALLRFAAHPGIGAVRPVIHADDGDLFAAAAAGLDLLAPVEGGASRQDPVRLGLESLQSLKPGRVLIHDAARPFADDGVISRVLDGLAKNVGAIPVLAVVDTLKRGAAGGLIDTTVPRDGLHRAQTPQGFHYAAVLAAHRGAAGRHLTDDAQVMEQAGHRVAMVAGSDDNIKVTTMDDLSRAARMVAGGEETRTGQGFDVHAFTDGDHVMLCGVKIAHHRALAGHSDADVALHALTDALLGAIGGGDIGRHFPPSDGQWKGAPSHRFLAHAAALLAARGGRLVNADVTVICETPRIGPHREAMAARIAEILAVRPDRVNVKGTTTEGLGFTGRGEGIAANAVVTVIVPGLSPP